MKKITVGCLFAFLFSSQCLGGVLSGAELKKDLTNGDLYKWNFGVGYIAGVIDTEENVSFCLPDMKLKEVVSVVVDYINGAPDRLTKQADTLVVKALSRKWPCEKGEANPVRKPTPKPSPNSIPKPDSPF